MRYLTSCFLIISLLCCVPGVQAQKVNEAALARKAQQARLSPTSGIERFKYMYFYFARNTFPEEPGWFSSPYKGMHIRALAIYFLNMQITANRYNLKSNPTKLTLNFLGVLDGLVGAPEPFDMAKATTFYQKNKKEVDDYFAQIRAHSIAKQWPAPSQEQLKAWLKLLESQPRRGKIATYLFPAKNFLQTPFAAQEVAPFTQALAQAANQARKKVITYETVIPNLEDLDSPIGVHHQNLSLTYRWVKDECFYATYTLGLLLADKIASKTLHKNTRLYVLTAYPKTGRYLQPADGQRFTLANGSTSSRWQYHTALLVVWPHEKGHKVLVLDSFLGGQEPLTLDQWLANFHAKTVFGAVPFVRNKKTEEAIKTPEKVVGSSVQIKGKTYEPHPVQ